MRVAALDVGEARIGVAVSEGNGFPAQGIGVVRRVGGRRDLDALEVMLAPYAPERLIVGLPLNMNGTEGPQAERVRRFAARAGEHLGLSVEFEDERLTTFSAEEMVREARVPRKRRREAVDKVAAVLILEGWLTRNP